MAEETNGAERSQPEVQYQLGVGALAARDYASAAEHFRLAESAPARRPAARVLRPYALCLAEQDGADCRMAFEGQNGQGARSVTRGATR